MTTTPTDTHQPAHRHAALIKVPVLLDVELAGRWDAAPVAQSLAAVALAGHHGQVDLALGSLLAMALECVVLDHPEAAMVNLWAVMNIVKADVTDQLRNG